MWAKNPLIRVASVVPVGLILCIFGFEWYAFNLVFVLQGLGRWQGEIFLLACVRVCFFNAAWLLALWSFLRASCSDPGFVPRWWAEQNANVRAEYNHFFGWTKGPSSCQKCQEPRPERAHHCSVCGKCVLRMDHHCPWIGNCVGANNHKYFMLMLAYGMLAATTYGFAAKPVIASLFGKRAGTWTVGSMGSKGFGVFSMGAVLAVSLCLAMSVLFLSHIWLMVVNRTSIEVAYSGRNPYSLSMLANAQQLCGRIGVDWFLPIRPLRPMTDGCNYPKFTDYNRVEPEDCAV